MCRLLGVVAPRPVTVAEVLGSTDAAVFADLARLHRDGWGSAWWSPGPEQQAEPSVEVAVQSGWGDARLGAVLTSPAAARIVHLRLATRGMACRTDNTHPFVADGMAFAHNGALKPLTAFDPLMSRRRAAEVIGTTDSERYFAAIRTALDDGATPVEAAAAVAGALRRSFPDRSLNALLLTDRELVAVHCSEGVPSPHGEFAERGVASVDLPAHHAEAYYLMRMKRFGDAVAVASSGLDITGWEPLPADSVVRIDLVTLAVDVVPLEDVEDAESRVA